MARAKRVPTTTLIVTTTADSGPGSLRQALADANNGDTIQFDPALNGQTISLTSSELAIDKNIAITGPGPNLLAVTESSGGNPFRIFHVMPGHTVIIEGLTIRDSAGILNGAANLSIINCIIRSNHLIITGGPSAIYNDGSGGSAATLTILNSTVTGNNAGVGGGIYNDGVNATLSLQNSSVDNNIAIYIIFPHSPAGDGGGIYNEGGHVTITSSSVSNNSASSGGFYGSGGGIYNTGTLTIINSTIHNNQGPAGGGIANSATLTITGSTVSSNVANGLPPISDGGGILNLNNGMLTISNSTISSNTAHHSGGGISGGGSISNSTISNNVAGQLNGGGIFVSEPLEIGNTILKRGTSGANIANNGGTVTSHGYNLSSDNGGGFLIGPGDQINTDPMLGPLQDNGGPTFTHELLIGSPALNAGDPNFTPPPDFDQRGPGFPRVFNGRIDIGSFELQTIAPTPSPTATATASPSATITPSPTPCLDVITQSSSQAITAGNSVSCNNTTGHTDNSYWRAFNVGTSFGGSYIVDSVSFGVESANNSQPVTVRLYRNTGGAFPGGTRTLIGTTTINVSAAQTGTVVTTPIAAVLPSGISQLVMELFTPDAFPVGNLFFVGSNVSPESGPSYLSAAACGITTPTTTAALGFPNMHIVFSVQGFCEGTPPPPSPTATATTTVTPTATATVTPTGTPSPSPTAAAQPLNLSTRMRVQTGDNIGIGGFIITGSAPKHVTVRGLGPSLGVPNPLADPVLELHGPSGFVTIISDNWKDSQDGCLATPELRPTNPLESAICGVPLDPGAYTAILRDKNDGTGVGLVEVYDVSQAAPSKLGNISTRAFVSTGANIVIAGFILGNGTMSDNVIVRGIGPSLAGLVPDTLADPTLELRNSNGTLIRADNDWQDDPAQAALISATGLAPTNPLESGIAETLPPGQYTALLTGLNNGTGVGLVEVYDHAAPY